MSPGWDFVRALNGSITIEHEAGGRRVLCLSGEIDMAVIDRFYAVYSGVSLAVDQIDAAGVTFISSAGLGVLLRCASEAATAGHEPLLRASSRQVDRLLTMCGVGGLFPRPDRVRSPADDVGA